MTHRSEAYDQGMVVSSSPVPRLVARACDRFALTDADHPVASGLGLWLLLALTAPSAGGPEREQLEDVLGCPAADAAGYARDLLNAPPPAVSCAAAAWVDQKVRAGAAYAGWAEGLPAAVQQGAIPDQQGADTWAREHTRGIIGRFPLAMTPDVVLVLASALATRVSWRKPFSIQRSELLTGPWATQVRGVLSSAPDDPAGLAFTSAGVVGWHVAEADGLRVVSVLGPPDAKAERVLRAAHEIAVDGAPQASLFDLPLRANDYGFLSEWHGHPGPEQAVSAILPAWSLSAQIPLVDRPGMATARATLARLSGGKKMDAQQVARARFTREGFEAAAVTGIAVAVSRRSGPPSRRLQLRFSRPYAVVAVATGDAVWDGVPVFGAWITAPTEAG